MPMDKDVRQNLTVQIARELALKILETQPAALGLSPDGKEDPLIELGKRFGTLLTQIHGALAKVPD